MSKIKAQYRGKGWAEARAKAVKSLEEISDEEDAELNRAALADPDNPPLTEENWARMRPASEVHPEIVKRYRGQRGPQKSKPVKKLVSLRVDPDVLEHYRSLGPGWMGKMNDVLRKGARLKKRA